MRQGTKSVRLSCNGQVIPETLEWSKSQHSIWSARILFWILYWKFPKVSIKLHVQLVRLLYIHVQEVLQRYAYYYPNHRFKRDSCQESHSGRTKGILP